MYARRKQQREICRSACIAPGPFLLLLISPPYGKMRRAASTRATYCTMRAASSSAATTWARSNSFPPRKKHRRSPPQSAKARKLGRRRANEVLETRGFPAALYVVKVVIQQRHAIFILKRINAFISTAFNHRAYHPRYELDADAAQGAGSNLGKNAHLCNQQTDRIFLVGRFS